MLAFVSEFVPRLYYTLGAGHDDLENFLNSSLSCFALDDFPGDEMPSGKHLADFSKLFDNGSCGFGMATCR